MKFSIVKAATDLGVNINGADLGPLKINSLDTLAKNIYIVRKNNVKKELDKENKTKNIKEVNIFNKKLYDTILNCNDFIITLGGDHSIAIASALASASKNENIGIIWIDAHSDYHTINSTITGNIHGMPLATINGLNKELSSFFNGRYINPKNTVIVGARDVEDGEYINLKNEGVTLFTTEDIKKEGVKKIMEKAFMIASSNTDKIHISYDIDVIDPDIASGVSVKAKNGINKEEAYEIMHFIKDKKEIVKSLDLVEYNPLNDINNETLKIIEILLNIFIN